MSEEPKIAKDKKDEPSAKEKILDELFIAVKTNRLEGTKSLKDFLLSCDPAEKFNLLKNIYNNRSLFRGIIRLYSEDPLAIIPAIYQGLSDEQIVSLLLQEKTDPDFDENCSAIVATIIERFEHRGRLDGRIETLLIEGVSDIAKRSGVLLKIIKQLTTRGFKGSALGDVGRVAVALLERIYDKLSPGSEKEILLALIDYYRKGLIAWTRMELPMASGAKKPSILLPANDPSEYELLSKAKLRMESFSSLQIQAIIAEVDQRETSSASSDKPDAKKELAFFTTPFKDLAPSDFHLTPLADHCSATAFLRFSLPKLELRFVKLGLKERYSILRHAALRLPIIGPKGFGKLLAYLQTIWHELGPIDKADITNSLEKYFQEGMPQEKARIFIETPKEKANILPIFLAFLFAAQAEVALIAGNDTGSSSRSPYQRTSELAKKAWEFQSAKREMLRTFAEEDFWTITAPKILKMIYQTHCFLADRYRGLSESLTGEKLVSGSMPAFNKETAMAAYAAFAQAASKDDYRACYQQQQFLADYYCQELLSLRALGELPAEKTAPNIDIDLSRFQQLNEVLVMFDNINRRDDAVKEALNDLSKLWQELPKDFQLRYKVLLTKKGWDGIAFCIKYDKRELLENMLEGLTSQQSFSLITPVVQKGESPFSLAPLFGQVDILKMLWEKLAPPEKIKMRQTLHNLLAHKKRYFGQSAGAACLVVVQQCLEEIDKIVLLGEPAAKNGEPNIDIHFSNYVTLSDILDKFADINRRDASVNEAMTKFPDVWRSHYLTPELTYKILSTKKGWDGVAFCVKKGNIGFLQELFNDLTSLQIFTIITTVSQKDHSPFSLAVLLRLVDILKMMWGKLALPEKNTMPVVINKLLANKEKYFSDKFHGPDCLPILQQFLQECSELPSAVDMQPVAGEKKREVPPPAQPVDPPMSWELVEPQQAAPAQTASSSARPSLTDGIETQAPRAERERKREALPSISPPMSWESIELSQATSSSSVRSSSGSGAAQSASSSALPNSRAITQFGAIQNGGDAMAGQEESTSSQLAMLGRSRGATQ